MKKKKTYRGVFGKLLALALVALMVYSGYRVWQAYGDYQAEAEMHSAVMAYKPEPEQIINQGVIDLQAKYPDVVGWLTVPGTKIDYPFVQAEDNDRYLRGDLDGNYALAGTLFMDCRCAPDFTSNNTIIYGHHMKNGSMFGTIKSFADAEFFDKNQHGTIFLLRQTLKLEFFAYMVVKSTDQQIYNTELNLDHVRQNARQYREIELSGEDRFVTLSTYSYEFDNARMILIARAR